MIIRSPQGQRTRRCLGCATATCGCSMFQGLGCSPIKVVRDLDSERRERIGSSI